MSFTAVAWKDGDMLEVDLPVLSADVARGRQTGGE